MLLDLLGRLFRRPGAAPHDASSAQAQSGVAPIEYLRRGLAEQQAGHFAQAAEQFRAAIALDANDATAWHLLGHLYLQQQQYADALAALTQADAIQPGAEIYFDLAAVYAGQKQVDAAVVHYEKALQLQPAMFGALNNIAELRKSQNDMDAVEVVSRRLIAIKPDFLKAYLDLGNALFFQGRVGECIDLYRAVLRDHPDFVSAHTNMVYAMNFAHEYTPVEVFEEHRRWGRRHADPLAHVLPSVILERSPDRRLRVGYVSPDFWHHPVSYFIEPVLRHHDHTRFDIVCYSDVKQPDAYTQRLRSYASEWKETRALSDEELANRIRADRIDILVDLAGHTDGNRLLTFARKPAPLQLTWMGYINTTGLAMMDYRITDNFADPPGMTEHLYSERLLRLPEIYMAYAPPADSPPVSAAPAAANGYVTFGSFNTVRKVTPAVVAVWARILIEVPSARLILFGVPPGRTRERLLPEFERHGVAAARIDMIGQLPFTQFLAAHAKVDIALDTFPFSGATATAITLWMGVPMITLAGRHFANRASVSMLSNLGLADCVATDEDGYVELAVALATEHDRCVTLRAGLRARMQAAPNTDGARLTAHLESAYEKIWQARCAPEVTAGGSAG